MGIKGWFEKKLREREMKKAARAGTKAPAKIKEGRRGFHDASKKGYKHKHGIGFVTSWKDEKKKIVYLHRPGWDDDIPTQHERVVAGRS